MKLDRVDLRQSGNPLFGFGGRRIDALGQRDLYVTFGEGDMERTELITFDVVDIPYPYNVILGHNMLNKCMKIPTVGGVLSIFGDQEEPRRREGNTGRDRKQVHVIKTDTQALALQPETNEADGVDLERMKPFDHTKKVPLSPSMPERTVSIGRNLSEAEERQLIEFLQNNQDVFA